MMPIQAKPNLQLVYVSDIKKSTEFYKKLFNSEPTFTSPRYVAFSAGEKALFAIWSGGSKPDLDTPRFSEIGVMLSSDEEVDTLFKQWEKIPHLQVVQKPTKEVFGLTFIVKDPDGHLIRVSPVD